MKRLFWLGLLLLTACQSPSVDRSAATESSPIPEATATRFIPTPVAATVTPTVTPLPTVTVTPPPPERYFTEEFDTAPQYWSILYASGDPDRVELLNENSTLTFEIYSQNTWVYAIYGAFEYEAVHIETNVESRGSQVNIIGLVCHYDEQDGWYEFNISNDGTYSVLYGQWLAEGIASYTPVLNDSSDRIQVENAVNEIGLDCNDTSLQLYINGKLIRSLNVEHIGLTGGKVGLAMGSFEEAPVILAFERVKVSEP